MTLQKFRGLARYRRFAMLRLNPIKRPPLPDSDSPTFDKFRKAQHRYGRRNATESVWKPQRSVPIPVATATPRKTAIIAVPIAKGRRKPPISFATVATVTAGI